MSLNNSEEIANCKVFNLSEGIPDFIIDKSMRKALCFKEKLIIYLKDNSLTDSKPVGDYSISVESIGRCDRQFLVHVISSMNIGGSTGGSKVISSSTDNLHCLEEKRTEYIYKKNELHEKVLYVAAENNSYYVEVTRVCPCEKITETKDLPFNHCDKLISEGANLILMRYLAITNFKGSLNLHSLLIEGCLVDCNYKCLKGKLMQINGQTIEVYKIERTLYKEARSIQKIQTFMTRDGRILQHDWLEVQYLLQINPLIDLKKFGSQKQSEALTMRTPWHEDMELISKYLDTKTCKAAQQSEYLADQPQMKQLIFDYVQALLIVKPSDVLNFTIQHFKSFAKYPERGEVSLSEEESEINVSSQFREKDSTLCKTCKICVDCKMLKTAPVVPIGEQFAELLQYPPIEPESPTFSSCSVRTKCSSDALCVRRQTRGNLSVTCINDCKPCNSDEIHTHFLDCVKTCEGCQRLSKPCPVHRSCPECLGCHKICEESTL